MRLIHTLRHRRILGSIVALAVAVGTAAQVAAQTSVAQAAASDSGPSDEIVLAHDAATHTVTVHVQGELFTRLVAKEYGKPILFPVLAAGGVPLTRGWPMEREGTRETDHPHHKSLWYGHGDVNGVDFWTDKGSIETQSIAVDAPRARVELRNAWLSGGQPLATDQLIIEFGCRGDARWIDVDLSIQAGAEPVQFGDTKEGFMAIRTHPHLRLTADPGRGVDEVYGTAVNSEGDTDKSVWGRRARWVFYQGRVEGQPVGIAIMDHPENLQHPTTWHARDYGLIAANPFGLHEFLSAERGAGSVTLPPGDALRFRYRFVFLRTEEPVDVEVWYREFAGE